MCSSSRMSARFSPRAIRRRDLSGRTYGADVRLATSHFLGSIQQLRRQRLRCAKRQWRPVRRGLVVRASRLPIRTTRSTHRSRSRRSSGNFSPALGFVQRDNVQLLRVGASYNPRPRFLNIQQMFHDVYFTRFIRLDNKQVESWDLYIAPLDWHLRSGDSVHAVFDVNPTYERLFETFEIAPGVILRPGEYRFTRFRAVRSTRRRNGALSGSFSVGSAATGRAGPNR